MQPRNHAQPCTRIITIIYQGSLKEPALSHCYFLPNCRKNTFVDNLVSILHMKFFLFFLLQQYIFFQFFMSQQVIKYHYAVNALLKNNNCFLRIRPHR